MAARAQGKFWEMHDLLFVNQRKVQRSDLVDYAKALGLDMARFESDLDSDRTKQLIAVAVAHVTQCPWCIEGHVKAARSEGASPEPLAQRGSADSRPPALTWGR